MSRLGPVKGTAMRPARPNPNAPRRTAVASQTARVGGNTSKDEYLYLAGIRDSSNKVTEYSTENDVCPACHTDRQFNKSLRLLVSPCYHKLCESCIDRLFALGPSPCPQCGKILRKINFAHQTFEDLKVEKEISIRRRMAQQYNKRREDFASDREYDAYLEKVEDLTYNLLNDIDVEATEAEIASFAKQNAALLKANQRKNESDLKAQTNREQLERQAREEKRKLQEEHDLREEREAAKLKAEVVEALALGANDRAKELQRIAVEAKALRAEQLETTITPALAQLLALDAPPIVIKPSNHAPTSPSYDGPFVPFAMSDPEEELWIKWVDPLDDYFDERPGAMRVKKNFEGRFRGGGYDLKEYWETEIRAAVEGLGLDPA